MKPVGCGTPPTSAMRKSGTQLQPRGGAATPAAVRPAAAPAGQTRCASGGQEEPWSGQTRVKPGAQETAALRTGQLQSQSHSLHNSRQLVQNVFVL